MSVSRHPAPDALVTVVTVVRNAVATLGEALGSVQAQRGVPVEHVVVDGGSTDGTVALIQRHASRLASWVSEPDHGIGDAMNKGIARARGEWLLFLHADDSLTEPDVLARALSRAQPDADFIACAIDYLSPGGNLRLRPTGFTSWLNVKTTFFHQGTLIRRRAFESWGTYDPRYRITMDYEFFLRAHRGGARAVLARDLVLARMGGAGLSSRRDWPSLETRLAEERAVHFRHAPPRLRALYHLYWALYPPYRRLTARAAPRPA